MKLDESQLAHLIPRLRRYARALTGNNAAADDLVQDTLERGGNKLYLWRAGTDLRAWLFTVMHNCFLNQQRAARRAQMLPLDEIDDPESAATGPEDYAVFHDVLTAVTRLKPEYREVLLLVVLEQMPYDEVARTLGIPCGTVMSRLARAREQLRGWMADATVTTIRRLK